MVSGDSRGLCALGGDDVAAEDPALSAGVGHADLGPVAFTGEEFGFLIAFDHSDNAEAAGRAFAHINEGARDHVEVDRGRI